MAIRRGSTSDRTTVIHEREKELILAVMQLIYENIVFFKLKASRENDICEHNNFSN